jgi:hypothetical protein
MKSKQARIWKEGTISRPGIASIKRNYSTSQLRLLVIRQ